MTSVILLLRYCNIIDLSRRMQVRLFLQAVTEILSSVNISSWVSFKTLNSVESKLWNDEWFQLEFHIFLLRWDNNQLKKNVLRRSISQKEVINLTFYTRTDVTTYVLIHEKKNAYVKDWTHTGWKKKSWRMSYANIVNGFKFMRYVASAFKIILSINKFYLHCLKIFNLLFYLLLLKFPCLFKTSYWNWIKKQIALH